MRTEEKAKAGPSTALRSGRDDNFVMRFTYTLEEKPHFPANELSSRPERSAVEGPALAFSSSHAHSEAVAVSLSG